MNTYPPSLPVSGSPTSWLSRWRRVLAVALVTVLTMGGGLAVVAASASSASAQEGDRPPELDPADCDAEGDADSGVWIPTPEDGGLPAVTQLRVECKVIIDAYNSWRNNPNSVFVDSNGTRHRVWWGWDDRHKAWGDGDIKDWNGVTVRKGAGDQYSITGLVVSPPSTIEASNSPLGVAGEFPASFCQLGRLTNFGAGRNRLSGPIPTCFANNLNLRSFDVARNNLSGNIPAGFASNPNLEIFSVWTNKLTGSLSGGFPNLVWLDVSGNSLNGELPSDINATGKILFFDASDNEFSGSIPSDYPSRFTRIVYFNLSDNDLDGGFSLDWINQISFVNLRSRPVFAVGNNRLCFNHAASVQPRPLLEPQDSEVYEPVSGDDDALNWGGLWHNRENPRAPGYLQRDRTRHAQILISVGGNICGDADSPSYSQRALPPVADVQKSINGNVLTIRWEPPTDPQTGQTYTASAYQLRITEAKRPNFNSGGMLKVTDNTDYTNFNAGYYDAVSTTTAQYDLQGDNSILRAGQTVSEGELVVNIAPINNLAQMQDGVTTVFLGAGEGGWQYGSWRSFNVRQDNTSAQELARNLGLFLNEEIYSWNAGTQTWNTHLVEDDGSTTLDMGTAVMFKDGVTAADNLEFAGVGRVDEDMVVTLQQGWNIMAPARANIEVGPGNTEALFDANLTDCDNLAGVLAIITYDSRIGDFKILLPCHPEVQTAGYDPLDVIDQYDTMYVFFQSQLSVPVTWDRDSGNNGNYVPA